jgi:hypothetical protein
MITVDDIVHIIQEEAAKTSSNSPARVMATLTSRSLESYKSRVRWLIANLGTALLASSIICVVWRGHSEDGGACRADADCDRRGRQCGHANACRDGARARHQPADPVKHDALRLRREIRVAELMRMGLV